MTLFPRWRPAVIAVAAAPFRSSLARVASPSGEPRVASPSGEPEWRAAVAEWRARVASREWPARVARPRAKVGREAVGW